MRYLHAIYIVVLLLCSAACRDEIIDDDIEGGDGVAEGFIADDLDAPAGGRELIAWTGQKATDAANDHAGSDGELYHEASSFTRHISVIFSGSTAAVSGADSQIKTYVDGAYVTIDFQSNNVSGVAISVSGITSDGGLKIYGAAKYLLELSGTDISSQRGPAINSQCKKRVFVHLAPNTINVLTDAADYTADNYYLSGHNAAGEDRKGCFFAEGHIIFSGSGTLEVRGHNRHGIATDGYMYMRPGATVAVTQAVNNCFHIKGDATDGIGLWVDGGLLYALASGPAAKAVKTDENIRIAGGCLQLNTTGDAIYDNADDDTSSAACLKADTYIEISGGITQLRSSGSGSKCVNAATNLTISGGELEACAWGEEYEYEGLTASAKAIKATQRLTISSGKLTAYACDDAIAAPQIAISGGDVTALSVDENGIRGKEAITISGGSVMACGGSAPACGISCDYNYKFNISGGQVIAVGGTLRSTPLSTGSGMAVYTDVTAAKGSRFDAELAGCSSGLSFIMPRTCRGATVLVAL